MWLCATYLRLQASFIVGFSLWVAAFADNRILLEPDYSLHQRPPTDEGEPLLIQASINLRNILEVREKEQLVSLETTLRLYWKDSRLRPDAKYLESSDSFGEYVALNPSKADVIWMPDIFIDQVNPIDNQEQINENSMQVKAIRTPTYYTRPASIRVYNDSTIRFPVDEQYCQIKFESFGFTNKQVQMAWLNASQSNVNANISLAQFDYKITLMDSYSTDYYDISYPGLIMKLHLTRQLAYHVVQTYIPSTVFVVIAWLSLFVPPESVPGRVGMGMTTLLTLTAMFSSVRQNVPRVSYVSLLDIWMLVCMIFVFACILEFIVITVYIRSGKKMLGEKIEQVAKLAIPLAFLAFNLAYWPVVLVKYVDGR